MPDLSLFRARLEKHASIMDQQGSDQCGFKRLVMNQGTSRGVELLELRAGDKCVFVCPTRGMSIHSAQRGDVRFGWNSPVHGPVHPMWVPLEEPSGLGWLSGFDELMVRCGLDSNGAPDFDDQGRLTHPLHGRIGNLPASDYEVVYDRSQGTVVCTGTVQEQRFHFHKFDLKTRLELSESSSELRIVDTVINRSDRPATFQMLYHCNFGAPLLGPGSQIHAPVVELAPRDEVAVGGLAGWDRFAEPDPSATEEVFFMKLAADDKNQTRVLLASPDQSQGAQVTYNTRQLPCFTLWKNNVGEADGCVTGLEPATNFPNRRGFETQHDRFIRLEPGASHEMEVSIDMLITADEVAAARQQVEALRRGNAVVHAEPIPNWCD